MKRTDSVLSTTAWSLSLCIAFVCCRSREPQPEPQPTGADQVANEVADEVADEVVSTETDPPAKASGEPTVDSPYGLAAEGTVPAHDIARARASGREQLFTWLPWSQEAFVRARDEGRHILLHCAAVWCHWCHVMEETTYRDPEIGAILRDRFVTIRVDIDSRPDIGERYENWGWPATVLFSPHAEELGKYRGYLSVDEMRSALTSVGERAVLAETSGREPGRFSPPRAAMTWIARSVTLELDDYYDPKQGSWGFLQKVPLGDNAYFEGTRVARGASDSRARLDKSLNGHARLIDPVWGGIYQYSTGGGWDNPHFEKLITYQTANLEAFARGYQVLDKPAFLDAGKRIADYVARFLTSPEGAFYVTQDADVGTHDRNQRFVDGNVYYARDEAGRLALGVPWVDEHVYAYENGLMIAALCTLYEVSSDKTYLERARRAADALIASHIEPAGTVRHDAGSASKVRHLADIAGLGRALARLAQVVDEPDARASYRRQAERLAAAMHQTLWNPAARAYYGHTPDANAAGVFTRRRHPFAHNVLAARFLATLAKTSSDQPWRERAQTVLIAIATPRALEDQGRMLGGFLTALDEAGLYPWAAPAQKISGHQGARSP